jgi:YHS domain-containing protein
MKKILLAVLLLAGLSRPVFAETWNIDSGGLFSKGTGAVINGYDPVAYFKNGKPEQGKAEFSATYQGGTFWFASKENRDLFQKNPNQYAPQYGGYCAYAVAAKNSLVEVDPTVWKIIGGKLYLNYDQDVAVTWNKDSAGYIKTGDANWTKLNTASTPSN